eukprot:scaffold24_cov245-Pinguiococcus_pyrenoidosus.AAC.8
MSKPVTFEGILYNVDSSAFFLLGFPSVLSAVLVRQLDVFQCTATIELDVEARPTRTVGERQREVFSLPCRVAEPPYAEEPGAIDNPRLVFVDGSAPSFLCNSIIDEALCGHSLSDASAIEAIRLHFAAPRLRIHASLSPQPRLNVRNSSVLFPLQLRAHPPAARRVFDCCCAGDRVYDDAESLRFPLQERCPGSADGCGELPGLLLGRQLLDAAGFRGQNPRFLQCQGRASLAGAVRLVAPELYAPLCKARRKIRSVDRCRPPRAA